MVASAQEDTAVEVGVAVVGVPEVEVVGVAPLGWAVASGEGAAAVAQREGVALAAGVLADEASEVHGFAVAVEHEAPEGAVAEEALGVGGRQGPSVDGAGAPGVGEPVDRQEVLGEAVADERGEVDDDVGGGGGGGAVRAAEVAVAQIREGVVAALGGGAGPVGGVEGV